MRKQCKTGERKTQRIREHKSSAHIWWGMMPFPISQTGKFYISQVLESSEKPCLNRAVKLVHLLPGSKALTNLHSILKSRHYFANKDLSSQSYGFSSSHVWIQELDHKESWLLKNHDFKLWCWRRLLRVLWTARRLKQLILKEISPEYSLEGLMVMLKVQYFGHLMWRMDSLENTLMSGKIEGRRRRGWQRMRWLDGITDSMDMSLIKSGSCW